METNIYMMRADSGIIEYAGKTLIGAKREASKWATFGGGSVYVETPAGEIYWREFWQNGNSFGWKRWSKMT